MRVAYFDALGGAAGDMILGALLDAGLPLDHLEEELAKVPLSGYRLHVQTVRKLHITATQFTVEVEGDDTHHHARESMYHGIALHEIETMIASSRLKEQVRSSALHVFRRLGEAEARAHGVPVDAVHFHEVGVVDTIVDIVGTAISLDRLGVQEVYCSALPLGAGTIETKHGTVPNPAPTTLDLLISAGAPVVRTAVHAQQVTLTGAAILSTLATFEQPSMRVERTGYGSGRADLTVPNVLRVSIGETETAAGTRVPILGAGVDDMKLDVQD